MDNIRISIVTPSYNQAQYLEETILSVISQNYPNLEYIIIDGGSTDGSIEIIKKYEDHLAYWESTPDKGMYCAIQKGFDKSTGEIMAWINSDDMFHKNSFYSIEEIFRSFKQVNWLVGASTLYDEFSRTVTCFQSRIFTKFDFYNKDYKWIEQESVFWRRHLWEQAGSYVNVNLKYAGDFDLWLRFFKHDRLFVTSALIGGFRFRSENQLSLDHMHEYLQEVESIINQLNLTLSEKTILKNYKRLLKLESLIKRLKLIRTDWMISRYRSRYFSKPARIEFDRSEMKFILYDLEA